MQWSSWLDIHKWIKRDYSTPYLQIEIPKYIFNFKRYTFFKLGKANFVFDLLDYKSYPIDESTYINIRNNNIMKISSSLLNELIYKNIIV